MWPIDFATQFIAGALAAAAGVWWFALRLRRGQEISLAFVRDQIGVAVLTMGGTLLLSTFVRYLEHQ
jgi:hypothetical protein